MRDVLRVYPYHDTVDCLDELSRGRLRFEFFDSRPAQSDTAECRNELYYLVGHNNSDMPCVAADQYSEAFALACTNYDPRNPADGPMRPHSLQAWREQRVACGRREIFALMGRIPSSEQSVVSVRECENT